MEMMQTMSASRSFTRPAKRKISLPGSRGRVWRWSFGYSKSDILEPGDPGYDEAAYFSRPTPTGLTEQEMLSTVNYLDEEALQKFPGVGPTIAQNILNWRTKNHYFSSTDELIQVSGVGPSKFKELTGRENLLRDFPLHDLFRMNRRVPISISDLQPLRRPAPGIEDLYLVSPKLTARHKKMAKQKGFQFVTRKVLDWQLCCYVKQSDLSARARYLFDKLPHLLRRRLKTKTEN